MRSRRVLRFAALAALLAACGETITAVQEEPQVALCARVDAAIARQRYADWNAVAARVLPGGYAGMVFVPPGTSVMLVHPESLTAVKGLAARAAECPQGERIGVFGPISSAVAAYPARHDWSVLRGHYDRLLGAMDSTYGLRMATIRAETNRVEIWLRDAEGLRRTQALAERLGLPSDVLDLLELPPSTFPWWAVRGVAADAGAERAARAAPPR